MAAGEEGRLSRQFRITGRVQGVGFRWYVHREAIELGLHGSVANGTDGSVAVEAEGPADAMDKLRTALRKGPKGCRVDGLLENELPLERQGTLGPFTIEGAV